MKFRFVIQCDANRVQGKFASSDELESQLLETLEGSDPGSLEGENGGEYAIDNWEVTAEAELSPAKIVSIRRAVIEECAKKIAAHWNEKQSRNTAAASANVLLAMIPRKVRPILPAPEEQEGGVNNG